MYKCRPHLCACVRACVCVCVWWLFFIRYIPSNKVGEHHAHIQLLCKCVANDLVVWGMKERERRRERRERRERRRHKCARERLDERCAAIDYVRQTLAS